MSDQPLCTAGCRNDHHGRQCGMTPCDCECHRERPATPFDAQATAEDAMREMGLHRTGRGGDLDPDTWRAEDPTCLCTAAERAAKRCSVPCPPEWIPVNDGGRPGVEPGAGRRLPRTDRTPPLSRLLSTEPRPPSRYDGTATEVLFACEICGHSTEPLGPGSDGNHSEDDGSCIACGPELGRRCAWDES